MQSVRKVYNSPALCGKMSWLDSARCWVVQFLSKALAFLRLLSPQHCPQFTGRSTKRAGSGFEASEAECSEVLDGCSYGRGSTAFSHWRAAEFPQLKNAVYLDHAGATLYAKSQLQAATEELEGQIFGNPHSLSDGSARSSAVIEAARSRVLAVCNTTPTEYSCVFTAGATGALKLLGEVFPWSDGSEFCYTVENHNSVLGIREYALDKGARACAVEVEKTPENAESGRWRVLRKGQLSRTGSKGQGAVGSQSQEGPYHLFGCPLECNFSGAKLDLALVGEIQKGEWTDRRGHWKVLLDAAKACGTAPPDLTAHPADFVAMSFYKMFGYPTGLGALLVRKDAGPILQKRYFSGGTVAVSIADRDFVRRRERLEEWLEDGTASFLGVAALRHGFDMVESLGTENIRKHTAALTRFTAQELLSLQHGNGRRVCVLYGNHGSSDAQDQGPVIAFNLMRPNGSWVGYKEVEKLAGLRGVQLRTGCFCNPGACAKYLGLTSKEMEANYEAGHVCWDDQDLIEGRPTGAVRVSFGYMSTVEDAQAFLRFVRDYFVGTKLLKDRRSVPGQKVEEAGAVGESHTKNPTVLEKILLYPIKSCGGFAPNVWPLGPNGLLYDREWLLVDAAGNGLTQKKVPALCTLKTMIDLEAGELRVTSRMMSGTLTISLHSHPGARLAGTVQVCGDRPGADVYGADVSSWFSEALGFPCTLVRQQQKARVVHRQSFQTDRKFTSIDSTSPGLTGKDRLSEGSQEIDRSLGFANEGQFLLVNQASVDELNKRIEKKAVVSRDRKVGPSKLRTLEPERFRPNLIVRGPAPFDEDTWQGARTGGQNFSVLGGCSRCSMITVDQKTGEKGGNESLLALASFRRDKGKLLFGLLLTHEPRSSQGDVKAETVENKPASVHRMWLLRRWPDLLECGTEVVTY